MSRIVVIDDEPFILMMVGDKLKKAGFDVTTVRESVRAMDIIRSQRPDLVIMDWMMPEISGIELCRAIKSDPELTDIPVIMLTAKGQSEDERLGLRSGVNRYIIKPFSPKALLEIVNEELGKATGEA